jgi:hypothetical protein
VSWECAECNASEGSEVRVDGVCHHCGKPLCRGDQVQIIDFVFAGGSGDLGQMAVHCRPCRNDHHLATDVSLGGGGR